MLNKILVLLSASLISALAFSQQIPLINHYYLNPSVLNPSYIGIDGFTKLNINHRQQWSGLKDAPVTSNLNLHVPLKSKLSIGANIFNDQRGLLTTSSLLAASSYGINLNSDSQLRFGLALGLSRNSIDISRIDDLSDPVFIGALDKSFFLDGQLGMSLIVKRLNLSFALPRIFKSEPIASEDFQSIGFNELSHTVSSISYSIKLNRNINIKPMAVYRTNELVDGQLEANLTIFIKDLIWLGGMYRENLGGAGHLGLRVNDQFEFGYSYGFGSNQADKLTAGNHEIHLGIRLGKKKQIKTDEIDENNEGEVSYLDDTIAREPESISEEDEPIIPEKETLVIEKTEIDSSIDENQLQKEVEKENKKPVVNEPLKIQEKIPAKTKEDTEYKVENIQAEQPSKIIEREQKEESVSDISEEFVSPVISNNNPNELGVGFYVVVGAFSKETNSIKYAEQLNAAGFTAQVGFSSITSLNYVYVNKSQNLIESNSVKRKFKQIDKFQFPQTWVLQIK